MMTGRPRDVHPTLCNIPSAYQLGPGPLPVPAVLAGAIE
jgi:hypothetical protein